MTAQQTIPVPGDRTAPVPGDFAAPAPGGIGVPVPAVDVLAPVPSGAEALVPGDVGAPVPDDAAVATAPATEAAADASDAARTVRRVLIVDDSRLQRRILTAQLAKWDYEVVEADSVAAALAAHDEAPADLVISDWVMPERDGLDLCRELRERDGFVYFILLTAKSESAEIAEGLSAGADDFLSKPVSNAELRARIASGARILSMHRALSATNARLGETLEELQRLDALVQRDLEEGRRLQRSLVPPPTATIGRAELSVMLHSSGKVGGDLVGYFPTGRDRIGAYGIDVSGHGITSALITARLKGFLSDGKQSQNLAVRHVADDVRYGYPPAMVAARLNEVSLEEMETEHYFTMVYAELDMRSGDCRFVQAGHPPPLILRADGGMDFVGGGGLPVGLLPDATYEEERTHLAPGDRLLIYSDGLTECEGPDGMLEEAGLMRLLEPLAGLPGAELLDGLHAALGVHAAGTSFADDLSALLVDYVPR